MNEIYKPVPNYEGIYEVSNYGNVRSCERTYTRKDGAIVKKRLRQRSLVVDNLGYVKVELHYHKRECFKVHRLVLLTFVGNKNLPFFLYIMVRTKMKPLKLRRTYNSPDLGVLYTASDVHYF